MRKQHFVFKKFVQNFEFGGGGGGQNPYNPIFIYKRLHELQSLHMRIEMLNKIFVDSNCSSICSQLNYVRWAKYSTVIAVCVKLDVVMLLVQHSNSIKCSPS